MYWISRLKITSLLLALTIISTEAQVDITGYFRTSSGINSLGTERVCFKNKGTPATANDFRLANECGTYSEINFQTKQFGLKTDSNFNPKVEFNARFAYTSDEYKNYTTGNVFIPESFGTISNIVEGSDLQIWVGKRFYRYVSSLVLDFFYIRDMSSIGAGVEKINPGIGTLDIAWLKETTDVNTTRGNLAKNALDFTWKELPLLGDMKFDYWLATAHVQGGTDGSGNDYNQNTGFATGFIFHLNKTEKGHHTFTTVYGNKNMESMTMANTDAKAGEDHVSKAYRWRFVYDMATRLSENLDLNLTALYENAKFAPDNVERLERYVLGFRPVYYFNDISSMISEFGYSHHNYSSEKEDRRHTRLTAGLQLHVQKRAATNLRFMASHNILNGQAKDVITSDVGDRGNLTNFVVQIETQF